MNSRNHSRHNIRPAANWLTFAVTTFHVRITETELTFLVNIGHCVRRACRLPHGFTMIRKQSFKESDFAFIYFYYIENREYSPSPETSFCLQRALHNVHAMDIYSHSEKRVCVRAAQHGRTKLSAQFGTKAMYKYNSKTVILNFGPPSIV